MKKVMFERGIMFCVFVRDDADIARIERVLQCKVVRV